MDSDSDEVDFRPIPQGRASFIKGFMMGVFFCGMVVMGLLFAGAVHLGRDPSLGATLANDVTQDYVAGTAQLGDYNSQNNFDTQTMQKAPQCSRDRKLGSSKCPPCLSDMGNIAGSHNVVNNFHMIVKNEWLDGLDAFMKDLSNAGLPHDKGPLVKKAIYCWAKHNLFKSIRAIIEADAGSIQDDLMMKILEASSLPLTSAPMHKAKQILNGVKCMVCKGHDNNCAQVFGGQLQQGSHNKQDMH